eukprot:1434744-Amphidinium_carterae.2
MSLHADVGSTDGIELCPGQGWRGVDGVVLWKAASCRRLGMSVPAILPLQDDLLQLLTRVLCKGGTVLLCPSLQC